MRTDEQGSTRRKNGQEARPAYITAAQPAPVLVIDGPVDPSAHRPAKAPSTPALSTARVGDSCGT